MRKTSELCLINVVYDYFYAYRKHDFFSGEIFIGEMYYKCLFDAKNYHENTIGILIKPKNISYAADGINQRGGNMRESARRIERLLAEQHELDLMCEQGVFDYQFINNFDQDSKQRFRILLKQITRKISRS